MKPFPFGFLPSFFFLCSLPFTTSCGSSRSGVQDAARSTDAPRALETSIPLDGVGVEDAPAVVMDVTGPVDAPNPQDTRPWGDGDPNMFDAGQPGADAGVTLDVAWQPDARDGNAMVADGPLIPDAAVDSVVLDAFPGSLLLPGDAWRLPGTPVVKLVQPAPDVLVALAERHAYGEKDGTRSYAFNHQRQVFLLRREQASAPLPFAALASAGGFLLTDVAPGPDADSVWIASMLWSSDRQQLEPSLHLVTHLTTAPTLHSYPLGAVQFNTLDSLYPPTVGYTYAPANLDTLDVLRIVSDGSVVGLVARNASGTPYAEQWRYHDGELSRAWRVPLSHPPYGSRSIMAGGTYDVMDQLSNRFKVHAALGDSGTLYAGIIASGNEINSLAKLPDVPGPALSASLDGFFSYAFVIAMDGNGGVSARSATLLGEENASRFLALTSHGDRVFVGGLDRDERDSSLESDLVFAEVGQSPHVVDVAQASGAIQTIGLDATGTTYVGGSWNWTQNPEGLSIAGGDRFFLTFDPDHLDVKTTNLLGQGRRRSEARTCLFPRAGLVCVGGMDNGPDTHAADSDITLLQGDGFVDCLSLPAPAPRVLL